MEPKSRPEAMERHRVSDYQNDWNTCQAQFPANAAQLNSDRSYEIVFLIRALRRKTLYNFVVKISSIMTEVI